MSEGWQLFWLVLVGLLLMFVVWVWEERAKLRGLAKNPKNYPNIVLALYGCAVAGVCLYTPRISGGTFKGWYFLWQGEDLGPYRCDLSLDVSRLVLELVIVTVIGGVAYLIVRQKPSP